MSRLRILLARLRSLRRGDDLERDLQDQIDAHLEEAIDEWQRQGLSPAEARRAALREFGGVVQTREAHRDARSFPWLEEAHRDARYALRALRRAPGFTAVAIATLALGVGLTASIFSVLHAVVMRPLPFPSADRLVMVWQTDRNEGTAREPASMPDLLDFTERSREIDRLGAVSASEATVQTEGDDPLYVAALSVSSSLLGLVGVEAIAGRSFEPGEHRPGPPTVVLISERLWARLFDRRPSAIGAPLLVNDRPATIAGVVADSADFGVMQILSSAAYARGFADRDARTRVDVWVPMREDRGAPRGYHALLMIGRLAAGATTASAQIELTRIAGELERTYTDNEGRGVFVEPVTDVVLTGVWTPMALLTASVVLVLLTAGVNLAILLLARASTRTGEIAVRIALGAESGRLLRQFFIENALLATAGAAAGLLMAYWTLNVIRGLAPASIPRIGTAGIDAPVVLVALAAAAIIAFALGFLPLARAGARKAPPFGRLRSALVAAEIAVAVVLLASTGLLARSLWRIYHVDPGFEVTRIVKAEIQLPPARYPLRFAQPAAAGSPFARFTDGLIERAERLPDVQAVALASHHPLDAGFTTSFSVVGAAPGPGEEEVAVRAITPRYFATMGVPIVSGRQLDRRDAASSVRAVVVNAAFADRFLPAGQAIDRRVTFLGSEWTIVGVVGNERFRGVTSAAPPAAYVPLQHAPWPRVALIARTVSGDPAIDGPALRSAVREVDPALAMFAVEPLEAVLTSPFTPHRFMATLLGLFALFAVMLATIGVYGVLSYTIAQKTHDIGIRMALGANAGQVVRLVIREGVMVTAAGTVAGIGVALVASRSLTSLLFEVTPADPITIALVVLLVAVVAATATWIPARRALRIDPVVALRS